MSFNTIALFGEAGKGDYRFPYFCHTLEELVEFLGEPPPDSLGLFYAIQALLYRHDLIFMRVREEGFSLPDYTQGLQLLENRQLLTQLSAICAPGVGDAEIINSIIPVCAFHKSVFITNQSDFYDYLNS